jgi:hypothetical protein
MPCSLTFRVVLGASTTRCAAGAASTTSRPNRAARVSAAMSGPCSAAGERCAAGRGRGAATSVPAPSPNRRQLSCASDQARSTVSSRTAARGSHGEDTIFSMERVDASATSFEAAIVGSEEALARKSHRDPGNRRNSEPAARLSAKSNRRRYATRYRVL